MYGLSIEIYQSKLRAMEAGDEAVHKQLSRGKDIMSVLRKSAATVRVERLSLIVMVDTVHQNMKASDKDKLDEDELISQVSNPFLSLHPASDFGPFSNRCRESLLSPPSLKWCAQMGF